MIMEQSKMITFMLEKDTIDKVKELSNKLNITLSQFIRWSISNEMVRQKRALKEKEQLGA